MAKTILGPNGGWQGKFGMSVGFTWRGLFIQRAYKSIVANPDTDAQRLQRATFALIGKLSGHVTKILKMTYRSLAVEKKSTPQGMFIEQNFSKVTGSTPQSVAIAWEDLILTPEQSELTAVAPGEANFDTPLSVEVTIDDGYSDPDWNSANDKVYLVVYSKTNDMAILSDGSAKRTDDKVTVTVPGFCQGDFVEAYVYVMADPASVRAGEFSRTIYCGSGRIA